MSRIAVVLVLAISALTSASAQRVERDVAYGDDPQQRLDLTLPDGNDFPVVIFVHGGSLTSGDKRDDDYRNVCTRFPEAGIACASINYRLGPQHAWPAPAEDLAAAIAWVHGHIAQRGGNPDKVFLVGHSSGAMLVVLVAADQRFLAAQHLASTSVRGVISMGSIMRDDDLDQAIARVGRERAAAGFKRVPERQMFASLDDYQDIWPERHVRAGMPSILFLVAESEQVNPPVLRTNQQFADEARALGNTVDVVVLTGRTHYSAIRSLHQPGDTVFDRIVAYVRGAAGSHP